MISKLHAGHDLQVKPDACRHGRGTTLTCQGNSCRKRVALAVGCGVVVQTMLRFVAAQRSGLWKLAPVPFFGPTTPALERALEILAAGTYLGITSRLAALGMGVLVAVAVTDESMRSKIGRQAHAHHLRAAFVSVAYGSFSVS